MRERAHPAILHQRTGGGTSNIDQTSPVSLAGVGTWKLRVRDAESADTGLINTWRLTVRA